MLYYLSALFVWAIRPLGVSRKGCNKKLRAQFGVHRFRGGVTLPLLAGRSMGHGDAERAGLPEETAAVVASRVAEHPGLVLPAHLLREAADGGGGGEPGGGKRRDYVMQLLLHDAGMSPSPPRSLHLLPSPPLPLPPTSSVFPFPSFASLAGVFLERHGKLLVPEDLSAFGALRDNYEVDFYLRLLQADAAGTSKPTAASQQGSEKHRLHAKVKNRRLAYYNRHEGEGFFSMEAMRDRDPLLWQHYVGRYEKSEPQGMHTTGKVYEKILEHHDTQELHARLWQEEEREVRREEMEVRSHQTGAGKVFLCVLSVSLSLISAPLRVVLSSSFSYIFSLLSPASSSLAQFPFLLPSSSCHLWHLCHLPPLLPPFPRPSSLHRSSRLYVLLPSSPPLSLFLPPFSKSLPLSRSLRFLPPSVPAPRLPSEAMRRDSGDDASAAGRGG